MTKECKKSLVKCLSFPVFAGDVVILLDVFLLLIIF